MRTTQHPLSADEATSPVTEDASAEVRAWQRAKIKAGLKAADEGRFASPDNVRTTIQKFIPNG
jgi:predicted transcriptional regulator